MFQIYSGSTGILSVQVRALKDSGKFAWATEEEAIAEYHEQKRVHPHCPLVVIEYTRFGGPHRVVIDDRKY
jgi:hypothetical protein